MRQALVFAIIGFAVCIAGDPETFYELTVGNHLFTAGVYKEIQKTNAGNFVMSPVSAEIILALVLDGADDEILQQFVANLYLPTTKQKIQNSLEELNSHFQSNDLYNLTSAHKIYIKDGYEIDENFEKFAYGFFNSEVENIDFQQTEHAVFEINEWVEEMTDERVKDLISAENLDADTIAVLVDAVYFRGKWKSSFDPDLTGKMPFYLNYRNYIDIDMMEQTTSLKYYESSQLNARFLELPYAGPKIVMTIVLPNSIEGLGKLEEDIRRVFYKPEHYCLTPIHVVLPKFAIETTIDLKEILQELGVVAAFEDDAHFDNIVDDEPMKLSQVIQKAVIEIDEEGVEDIEESDEESDHKVVELSEEDQIHSPKDFIADHPFIFYIKIKDIILFVGKYVGPTPED